MAQIKDWRWFIGIYLVSLTVIFVIVILMLWPEQIQQNNLSGEISESEIALKKIYNEDSSLSVQGNFQPNILTVIKDTLNFQIKILSDSSGRLDTTIVIKPILTQMPEHSLLLLILILGALGACLHGLTSLAEFIGNKNFTESWVVWYLLRPFVGGVLSLIFYVVIRGGFLPQVESTNSFYLLTALAGLTGLFSKQALYKLSDIFDTIFQSKKGGELKDKLISGHPVPVIKSITPNNFSVGSKNQSISINGSQFIQDSIVKANDKDCATTFRDDKNLTAILDDSLLLNISELDIKVFNPEPGGGYSESVKLTVA
jgi:hypothetical protein